MKPMLPQHGGGSEGLLDLKMRQRFQQEKLISCFDEILTTKSIWLELSGGHNKG